MSVSRIEALVCALGNLNGAWTDPRSEAFQLRNPLLLLAYNPKHQSNERGHRQFVNFASGFDNCITDLKIKVAGKSRSHLTPFSTLEQLVQHFGHANGARTVKNFLRGALQEEVMERTQLRYFGDESLSIAETLASVDAPYRNRAAYRKASFAKGDTEPVEETAEAVYAE